MDNDSTIVADQNTADDHSESQRDGHREDPLIPIPASKWREAQETARELKAFREQSRTNLPEPSKSVLTPEADAALDQIADRTAGKFKTELTSVQDELDDLAFERGMSRIMGDDDTKPYRTEIFSELKKLQVSNPKARMSDLIEQAEERAIVKAFRSGKLSQSMAEEAQEQMQTKTRLSPQAKGSATKERGKESKSLADMSPEELVTSGRLNEYYAETQGRAPRR